LANGIRRAKCLVTVLPNDAVNVFITLTSRNLNPQLQIIARGEQHSTHKKLLQAGANRVVLPAAIGAMRIAAMVTHPSTVELMELVAGRSVLDVEVDELHVPDSSPLVGRTIREIEARSRHGLLVVAIKHSHGGMIFNPEANLSFQSSDIIIVMGRVEDIERFRREYQL
jgi:voltage-gated potassium channel